MTYNAAAVSDTAIAFKKPITLQQGRALRDNLLAVSDGMAGAPKVKGKALDVFLGILTFSSGKAQYTGLDRVKIINGDFNATGLNTSPVFIQARFSSNNGATWGAWQNVVVITNGTSDRAYGRFYLDLESGSCWANAITFYGTGALSSRLNTSYSTLTVPSNCNAVQFGKDAINGTVSIYGICLGGRT